MQHKKNAIDSFIIERDAAEIEVIYCGHFQGPGHLRLGFGVINVTPSFGCMPHMAPTQVQRRFSARPAGLDIGFTVPPQHQY